MNGVGDVAFMAASPFLLKNSESIRREGPRNRTPCLVGMENFENEKTQTSDSRGGSFRPVSGSADIFPVFRRRNGAQPRREGRIFLQPDPF